MASDVPTTPSLTPPMQRELERTAEGRGRYWPNGVERRSLKALANRRLVGFRLGYGWYLTEEGARLLSEEKAHA